MGEMGQRAPRSVAAIVGLVLGIIAIVMSWMPIVNNIAFFVAVVGAVFALVGVVGTVRGKRAGKGLAIAALAVNVAAVAIVLGTQSMYGAAIDEAVNGPGVVSTQEGESPTSEADDDSAAAAAEAPLAAGSSVTLDNGLQVTVDSVEKGLANFDGATMTGIHVTYVNTSQEEASYNSFDWKGADVQGAAENQGYYSEGADELSYGTLAAGGSVSGNIYFEGDIVEAWYYASAIASSPTATWTLG